MSTYAATIYQAPSKPSLFPASLPTPIVRTDTDRKVDLVLSRLTPGKPFATPEDLAPLVGLKDGNSFRVHCRKCTALRMWQGNYVFQLDDPEHVQALRILLKSVLWSGTKIPDELKPSRGTNQRGASRVQ